MLPRLKILFLCTGNSCRSQMAEAWARSLHGKRFEVHSAGTRPGLLDPRAVRAMAEVAIDISDQRAKHVDEVAGVPFDYVITVCDSARESCPVLPGEGRRLHAGFDDPPRLAAAATGEEEALAAYRRVRDEIRTFVRDLPRFLDASTNETPAGERP